MDKKENVLAQIKNQVCWRAWRGGRSAIFFELGEKLPNKKGETELRRGTYTLGIDACPWQIFQNGELLFNDRTDFKKMDELLKVFEGKTLFKVKLNETEHKEEVIFSGDLSIQTYHNKTDDEWYILTPSAELAFFADKVEIEAAENI